MPPTATTNTIMKMLDSLPEHLQERALEHMSDYLEDLRDEARWDASFARTQPKLVAAARQARREIAGGKASPMDEAKL